MWIHLIAGTAFVTFVPWILIWCRRQYELRQLRLAVAAGLRIASQSPLASHFSSLYGPPQYYAARLELRGRRCAASLQSGPRDICPAPLLLLQRLYWGNRPLLSPPNCCVAQSTPVTTLRVYQDQLAAAMPSLQG